MLSKKSKSYDNSDKVEQEALKKVETIAELAPNEKTRKEAEKLIETIEGELATSVQEETVDNVLDKLRYASKYNW
jgi:hypothetical protein